MHSSASFTPQQRFGSLSLLFDLLFVLFHHMPDQWTPTPRCVAHPHNERDQHLSCGPPQWRGHHRRFQQLHSLRALFLTTHLAILPARRARLLAQPSAHAVVLAEAWPPDHLMQPHAVQLHVSLTATCSTHNQPATTLLHLPCVPRRCWQPKLSHHSQPALLTCLAPTVFHDRPSARHCSPAFSSPATKSPRQHGQALPIQDKSLPTQVPPSQRNTTAHRLNWLRTRSHRSGPLRRSR